MTQVRGRGRLYVFDTSAFIAAWVEQYPPENFPAFWQKMHELAEGGRLIAPEDVHLELEREMKVVSNGSGPGLM